MSAKDSQIFSAVLQFGRSFKDVYPETVIYGYAKLLSMDEAQVKNIISEENMSDLETAHKWFTNNKLDLKLIRSGLLILLPLIIVDEDREKCLSKFQDYITQDKNVKSEEILNEALADSYVEFKKYFIEGNSMADIFDYQNDMKEKYDEYARENDSKDANDDEDSDADETSGEKSAGSNSTNEKSESDKTDKSEKTDGSEKSDNKKADKEARRNKHIELERSISKDKTEGKKGSEDKMAEEPAEVQDLNALSEKYRNLNSALLDVVKGQDQAVLKFVQGYNQGELLKYSERGKHPRSYFFFFGPPGVGKTLLAETAAEALDMPFKVFNMSEYSGHQAHEGLIGVSKIYNNAKEGELVKFVRENKECLLVFDEIEKAHLNVIRLFLQILGSGKLHNIYKDNDVSFQDTTIIFTSNVGGPLYEDKTINLTTLPEKVLIDAIQKEKNSYGEPALPPEICSRIASGNTIMFNHLSIRHLANMVSDNFEKIVVGMEKEYDVKISYSKYLPLLFLYNRGGDIDARVATGQSGKFFKDEVFELLRQLQNSDKKNKIKSIEMDVDWRDMDPELLRLFKNDDVMDVLFFSDSKFDFENVLSSEHYKIHCASSIEDAKEYAKGDVTAVYIDPFYGKTKRQEKVLSIADYNTDGVKLFHDLVESQGSLPIYMLETEEIFSDVDRRTFIQEGAFGTVEAKADQLESFKRQFEQTMEELYMEKESQVFCQRGWIIDFNTKQTVSGKKAKIMFYGLRKRMAIGLENRGSVLSAAERPKVKFTDVIGAKTAKEELEFFVKYLKNPKKFIMNGGKPPKGVLLYGPPGTGKTMLAKAMAGECDVAFIPKNANDFKNSLFGESEENIRKLFARAKALAPAVIFLDEVDALGKKRRGGANSDPTESMLNTLLTEMDGFGGQDVNKPVFILAATNYGAGKNKKGIDDLDEALVRRFTKAVYVDLPREAERKEYIIKYLKDNKITTVSEETAQNLAERTTGKSLAILQNIADDAITIALKESRKVKDADFVTALENHEFGDKREHSAEYYKRVAVHEAGHAYLTYISGDKPSFVTIESRDNFGGYVEHGNPEQVTGYNKEEMLSMIRTSLAGRAAEQVFFGDEIALNTGASSDLQHATRVAFEMLCTYGMDGGLVVLDFDKVMNSALAEKYVLRANEILAEEMEKTISIIKQNKDKIQLIADALVKENRLTGPEFEALMK